MPINIKLDWQPDVFVNVWSNERESYNHVECIEMDFQKDTEYAWTRLGESSDGTYNNIYIRYAFV